MAQAQPSGEGFRLLSISTAKQDPAGADSPRPTVRDVTGTLTALPRAASTTRPQGKPLRP